VREGKKGGGELGVEGKRGGEGAYAETVVDVEVLCVATVLAEARRRTGEVAKRGERTKEGRGKQGTADECRGRTSLPGTSSFDAAMACRLPPTAISR